MLAVLRRPGVAPLFVASMVARLPMGALGLLFVLQQEEATGSYARGGAIAAAYIVASALLKPVLARRIDRHGQTLVLRAGAVAFALGVGAIALLPADTPLPALLALAVLAGLEPPVMATMRSLWPRLLPHDDARHAAYSLESVALEVVYILGPVAIVGGLGAVSPQAALLACAAFTLLGDWAFAAHPVSKAERGAPAAERDVLGALRLPAVRALLAMFFVLGASVGAVEVGVAASTGGDEGRTGLLLGLWGVGSLLAGVAIARVGPALHPQRRLVVFVGAWALTHAAVGLAPSDAAIGAVLVLAGATIAPTFVTVNGLLDGLVPQGRLAEAFTWTSTGMTAGVAGGNAVAGVLADAGSPALAMGALGLVALLGAPLALRTRAPAYA